MNHEERFSRTIGICGCFRRAQFHTRRRPAWTFTICPKSFDSRPRTEIGSPTACANHTKRLSDSSRIIDNRGWLTPKQPVVEQRNLAPACGYSGRSLGVNCRNGRLQSVGTEAMRCESTLGERNAFSDLVPVPQRPILLLQQDQVSVRGSGGAARLLQQHVSKQTLHLGFRKQVEQQPAKTDRLAVEFGACYLGRISLIKDEIYDLKDSSQTSRQFLGGWHLVRNRLIANESLRAHDALGERCRCRQKYARAISSVVRPQISRRVSATRPSGGRAGWVKIRRRRSSSISSSSRGASLTRDSMWATRALCSIEARASAHSVYGLEACR